MHSGGQSVQGFSLGSRPSEADFAVSSRAKERFLVITSFAVSQRLGICSRKLIVNHGCFLLIPVGGNKTQSHSKENRKKVTNASWELTQPVGQCAHGLQPTPLFDCIFWCLQSGGWRPGSQDTDQTNKKATAVPERERTTSGHPRANSWVTVQRSNSYKCFSCQSKFGKEGATWNLASLSHPDPTESCISWRWWEFSTPAGFCPFSQNAICVVY